MEYAYKLAAATSSEMVNNARKEYLDTLEQTLIPTINMIRTVFVEAVVGVSFRRHPDMVELQKANGVPLGSIHYSEYSAKVMVETISTEMHRIVLNELLRVKPLISIIADTTTSKRNVPFLIIFIQTLEDNYPITYFHSLLALEDGESAVAMSSTFWHKIAEDDKIVPGFLQYVKDYCRFVVTDGASSMVGNQNSFFVELQRETTATINSIQCLSHKLSLTVAAGIRNNRTENWRFVTNFEHDLNSFYNFYQSRGSKRFQHLVETAEMYQVNVKRLKKNILVRWSAAEFNVVATILDMRHALREDTKMIKEDVADFTASARQQAAKLYSSITDISNMILYHEFHDFLSLNSEVSRALQEESGIILDHYPIISKCMADYDTLKTFTGPKLTTFLSFCKCAGVCEQPRCNLQQVEDCANPICEGVTMSHNVDPEFCFYRVRHDFYNRTVVAMAKYFDFDVLENLHIAFDNRLFVGRLDFVRIKTSFVIVCKYLHYENEKTERLWVQYQEILEKCKEGWLYGETDIKPSEFWPMALSPNRKTYVISDEMRHLLQTLLIWSSGSAQAERGFNIMQKTATSERAALSSGSTEHLLRIKINGVDDPSASTRDSSKQSNYKQVRRSRLF